MFSSLQRRGADFVGFVPWLAGISYGDRLNFEDVDAPREVEEDGSDMLNRIQLDL